MFLVTGASGFIGGHLVNLLAARGIPVRCLLRRPSSASGLESAELVRGDLATGDGLASALRGITCVIHLAGTTKALRARDYYTGNATATRNLVAALAGHTARLVHVSSLAAAGPSPDGVPLDESDPPAPFTHYGKSKLEAERAARAYPAAVIVRPPVVYGPRDTDVFQLLRSISRGLVVEIAGGERHFSAIYVKDLALGLLTAATHPAAPGRTWYLTHPDPLTWTAFSATAAAIMHRSPRVLRIPYALAYAVGLAAEAWSTVRRKPSIVSREKIAEARCPHWTCSAARAAAGLGFTAPTPLSQGLAESLVWYREAGWLNY